MSIKSNLREKFFDQKIHTSEAESSDGPEKRKNEINSGCSPQSGRNENDKGKEEVE
jgi:hypothetical protein